MRARTWFWLLIIGLSTARVTRAADVDVEIPGGTSADFDYTVYFNFGQLDPGETKTLRVHPAPCYHFTSGPGVTAHDANVKVIQTSADQCQGQFQVSLLSGNQGAAHVTGHIEYGTQCGCSGSGQGSPPPGRNFDIDVLNRLAWVYFTTPANGTNLTVCACSTNNLAVKVVLGTGDAPSAGSVSWTPAPSNLGSVTPASTGLSGGNASTTFYAGAAGGSGQITANATGLTFAQGNPVTSVSTNITANVVCVNSLTASPAGTNIGGNTNAYCWAPSGLVTVTAASSPILASNQLPNCWHLYTNGVDLGQTLSVDVPLSNATVTTVIASAGACAQTNVIAVVQVTLWDANPTNVWVSYTYKNANNTPPNVLIALTNHVDLAATGTPDDGTGTYTWSHSRGGSFSTNSVPSADYVRYFAPELALATPPSTTDKVTVTYNYHGLSCSTNAVLNILRPQTLVVTNYHVVTSPSCNGTNGTSYETDAQFDVKDQFGNTMVDNPYESLTLFETFSTFVVGSPLVQTIELRINNGYDYCFHGSSDESMHERSRL